MQNNASFLEHNVDLATTDALRPGFKDRSLQEAIAL
jgi:predicted nucleotidyltransferase